MNHLRGHILTPKGFIAGSIEFEGGRVRRIVGEPITAQAVRDAAMPKILPGFIDLHVHGGGGHDVMQGGDAATQVAALHVRHGTTSLLATTMTAPPNELEHAFVGMRTACAGRAPHAARILGVHLEGPYIHKDRLGAQPDYARPLDLDELQRLNALAPVRLITLAPEVPGHMEAIEELVAAGFRVQIGHTGGSYEDGVRALVRGARGFTHLFNAMTPMHHRAPGMAGAALAHATYAEIIPDLIHVHPGAIRVALRSIACLYCVTDSTAAAGMPDGQYQLGRLTVTRCLGGVRLPDGTLAGSVLTMDQALRNLVNALGLDLSEASQRVSTFAADYLGLSDRGRLLPGAWGDVVVLDRDLQVIEVLVEGEAI
jgi:N-acetylglucosamine-6-phosphate deacetylase